MVKISIILPTYNRLEQLRRVLAGLEHQDYPLADFEVLVISDGSTDGTDRYLATLTTPLNLRVLRQPNQGAAAARNYGLAHAQGDLVVFLDDDVRPLPTWLAEHALAHAGEAQLVVLGPMLTPPDFNLQPWVRWEQAMLMKQYAAMTAGYWQPTARQFYTGNTSLARRYLETVGGFDTRLRRAEDVELGYRLAALGLRFVFRPAAVGYHYAQRSFRSWTAIAYTYGRHDVSFDRDHGQSWLLPTVLFEYRLRSRLVRSLTRLCLGRQRLSQAGIVVLRCVAAMSAAFRIEPLVRAAYSGIFNLRYYQGMADELGGRAAFFGGVARATVWVGMPETDTPARIVTHDC